MCPVRTIPLLLLAVAFGSAQAPPAARPENKIKAGDLVIDPQTLINLGFEWPIEGDDNRNAKVEVSYRKQGDTQWKQGLPLLQLQGERIFQAPGVWNVQTPNMFAGSILDLEPDTAYQARFVLSDPDGFIDASAEPLTAALNAQSTVTILDGEGCSVVLACLVPAYDCKGRDWMKCRVVRRKDQKVKRG